MARNGEMVKAFEAAFAEYVGARFAIALANGTCTLHVALHALGVKPGDRVAVPPLTMSSTTIAVLHAGAVPVFCDVDQQTWLMGSGPSDAKAWMGVSLYGLSWPGPFMDYRDGGRMRGRGLVDDAAQTLAPFRYPDGSWPDFKSYSFQASKILSLGEGGMLVTNDEELATRAREFSSLGYRMRADQPRIDPKVLKSPTYARHHTLGWNYRMNDLTAEFGLQQLRFADVYKLARHRAADLYRDAIADCDWLTPQYVPDGWQHDMWTFAVATDTPERCLALLDAAEKHGGERPYPAWRITYHEPAFAHLNSWRERLWQDGSGRASLSAERTHPCPVAESLQPRILAFQTNNLASAERNATALRLAIAELS